MKFIRTLLREVLHFLIRSINYRGYKKFAKQFHVNMKSIDETIDYILANDTSVSRFGDGEFMVMNRSGNGFQKPDEQLANRLKEVFDSQWDRHIICIPNAFSGVEALTSNAKTFWYPYFRRNKEFLFRIIDPNKVYYNTSFTRFYMSFRDKSHTEEIVNKLRLIWHNRNVVIVEGVYTLLGVGNDLFDNAKSIKRIIGPSKNAFSRYDEILSMVLFKVSKDSLILCALGMTATVLCYDLARLGYQAIDIGHIDIEYSWYKMGAKHKCAIPGKAVNEVGINNPQQVNVDKKYKQSIIGTIK